METPSLAPQPLFVTFLGTGASMGTPVVGCNCDVCHSADPRDVRLRSSVVLRRGNRRVLVDPGPDVRQQSLRAGITRIDEVWLTHAHSDHCGGIDDLRPFCRGRPLPVRGAGCTLAEIRHRWDYAFHGPDGSGITFPDLEAVEIKGSFRWGDDEVIPLPVEHGPFRVLGFRIGTFAYVTDVNRIPPSTIALMGELSTLVLSGLRLTPHPTHWTISEAVEAFRELGARRLVLTHFAHDLSHLRLLELCPPDVVPAHDGWEIEV